MNTYTKQSKRHENCTIFYIFRKYCFRSFFYREYTYIPQCCVCIIMQYWLCLRICMFDIYNQWHTHIHTFTINAIYKIETKQFSSKLIKIYLNIFSLCACSICPYIYMCLFVLNMYVHVNKKPNVYIFKWISKEGVEYDMMTIQTDMERKKETWNKIMNMWYAFKFLFPLNRDVCVYTNEYIEKVKQFKSKAIL